MLVQHRRRWPNINPALGIVGGSFAEIVAQPILPCGGRKTPISRIKPPIRRLKPPIRRLKPPIRRLKPPIRRLKPTISMPPHVESISHLLMARQLIGTVIIYFYGEVVAGHDGSFVSTGACNLEVPDSNPGYLSSWLCIYCAPNCSKAWIVQCCLWYCAL